MRLFGLYSAYALYYSTNRSQFVRSIENRVLFLIAYKRLERDFQDFVLQTLFVLSMRSISTCKNWGGIFSCLASFNKITVRKKTANSIKSSFVVTNLRMVLPYQPLGTKK